MKNNYFNHFNYCNSLKDALAHKKRCLFLLVFLLCLTFGYAQNLSLDSCQALALRNNVATKNAVLDVAAAREVKKQLFTKYFPNVSITAAGYHALNPMIEYDIDDIESAAARQLLHDLYFEYGEGLGLPNSISLCENGVMVGATAVQPLFMGGQIVNGNKLANVGVQAAELQSSLTQEQLSLQVEEAYWLVVSLQQKKLTLQQALTFFDTLYRDVTIALDAGLVTQNDQLKVTLKQNEMRSNKLKVDNGIALATMALCQMIGVPYTENVILTDTLASTTRTTNNVDPTAAVRSRKEAQLLNLNVEAEQLRKKITLGETLPHLMIGAGASYGNPIFEKYSANGLVFAMLQVPLTSWWETSHKLKQQNYVIQKAENQRTDLIQKMELETQQALNNVHESAAQIELMEATVHDAEVNLQSVKSNYEAGMVAISDLLEAQTLYRQAQDQLTDARIDYRLKCAKLEMITK